MRLILDEFGKLVKKSLSVRIHGLDKCKDAVDTSSYLLLSQ